MRGFFVRGQGNDTSEEKRNKDFRKGEQNSVRFLTPRAWLSTEIVDNAEVRLRKWAGEYGGHQMA
jgi:hypothetical protein